MEPRFGCSLDRAAVWDYGSPMDALRRQIAAPLFLILVGAMLMTLCLGAGEGQPPARGGEVGAPVVTN